MGESETVSMSQQRSSSASRAATSTPVPPPHFGSQMGFHSHLPASQLGYHQGPHYPYSMTPYEHAPSPYAAAPHHAYYGAVAPHHLGAYNYGDTSITHHSRVADAEHTALSSDCRLADQEHRRMSDLALRDNFERRLSELEAPIRDLKQVCEQRLRETQNLQSLIPRSTGAPGADLEQIRKTNISPVYKVRLLKDLPVSTQDKLNLMQEFRMAETMDDVIREREKDLKRTLQRHVY